MSEVYIVERLTDRKRAAILTAAIREFEAHGFDNTSMNRIAEVAEVSKRTVYNHFESKESLFEAIVTLLIENTESIPAMIYQRENPLEEQLRGYAENIVRIVISPDFQSLARVVLSRFLLTPNLAKQTIGDEKRFCAKLVTWIEAAVLDGRLQVDDTEMAGKQFNSLLQGSVFWPPLLGSNPTPDAEEIELIIDSAVSMFLARYQGIQP
ncbi:TetR/AcrR family transcriptional regulator [Bremerella alba]|uniref:HTH tetR-type domain-containing protein n=1 Tax=Bremerella alba TaxID=980252 RepID=A0A7V8V0W9_9BACT|nr:TetR/AcrR family transcriptional regulator [Bremerella alba]MBA2112893.1 hypothetical protein [Bremerella alba]